MKKLTLLLVTALSLLSIMAEAQEESVQTIYRGMILEIPSMEIVRDQPVDFTFTVFKNSIKVENNARSIYIANPNTKIERTEAKRKYIQYDFVDEQNIRGYLRFSKWNDGDKTLSIHYQDVVIMYWYR